MKDNVKYMLYGMGIMLILFLLSWRGGCGRSEQTVYMQPDTVFVDKPYKEIVIKEIEKEVPKTVYVYKTDTIFRQQLEKDTLITGIEITPKLAKIHSLTPLGIPIVKEFPMPEFKQITIDHKGNTQIKPKKNRTKLKNTLRLIGFTGVFVGGVWMGVKISQYFFFVKRN